jgi:predicted nucleotidyltransferase
MVDFHNCISLAKNIRWEMEFEPVFINGGTLEPEKFKRTHLRKDLGAVLKSFPIHNREEDVSSAAELETMLLSLITKKLRRWSYERTEVGDILFYLWEQFRYAKNVSMVLNTIQLEDETVRKSIIA